MTASWRLVVRVEDEGLMEHGSGQREDKYWTIEALSNFWSLITDLLSLRLIWALRYHHKMRCMGGRREIQHHRSETAPTAASNCRVTFFTSLLFFFFLPQRYQKKPWNMKCCRGGFCFAFFRFEVCWLLRLSHICLKHRYIQILIWWSLVS